jgi:elongation factor P
VLDGEPYEVVYSQVSRKQANKPVNSTKLRNLLTGKVVEHSFHQSNKVDEAELETKKVKYLYANKGEYWFCDEKDPSKRFTLPAELVADQIRFVKQNSVVDLLSFDDRNINIKIPIKAELKVIDAPMAVKGNTATGTCKQITLETGTKIDAPMFINEGDMVIVNTDTGEYSERGGK